MVQPPELEHHGGVLEQFPLSHTTSVGQEQPLFRTSHSPMEPQTQSSPAAHTIKLSGIEHCMPRAYIRVCLAYRVASPELLSTALSNLRNFVRKAVDAKPYLSGYLVPATDYRGQRGRVEISFSDEDFLTFLCLQERVWTDEEMPYAYEELDRAGVPPTVIRPDLVSALPEGADENRAPILRVQANILPGGLIVSFYLHHCISDGTGLGLLISGSVMKDNAFQRHLPANGYSVPSLTERLNAFAIWKTTTRKELSWSSPNEVSRRHLHYKYYTTAKCISNPTNPPGRGCILTLPYELIRSLQRSLEPLTSGRLRGSCKRLTLQDTVQSMLWHSMTKARTPSLQPIYAITHSKLLIPVDIRGRLQTTSLPKTSLPEKYFGSAVDFASVEMSLEHLSDRECSHLASTAIAIHNSCADVDDKYIRSSIAIANSPDPTIDVRDLLASNMNRVTGADMYITSWWRLGLYECELEMGLGKPEWVRKPWSKDPGSCIILPRDPRKETIEVVVQMCEADMERLLDDKEFMKYVRRVIE